MSWNVLVVDDSLTIRMDLADAFEAAGFVPFPCGSVAEARKTLDQNTVSIAILDVLLPDGNGVDLLKEIKTNPSTSHTPVLMLSSEAEIKDRIRGMQTGADDYVGKPYQTEYVVARATELMRVLEPKDSIAKPSVLLIDDSATFRQEMRQAFQEAGFTVLMAENGEEGLRLAAAHRPSAIVVDGVMPGIDGATVIRKIRFDAALRGTPCILLTASEESGAELGALDAGADAFIRKNESLDVMVARLHAVLRSATAERNATATLLGPKKVMAVDDSATYLQHLAAELRAEGYDVILARSGEEAIDMLAVQPVDCVLLDLVMPGLGGKETCRRIKMAPVVRDIPLIMVTAVEDRSAMIEGLAVGADDYISKSSEFEVLKARLRAQLRRKQFEDEHRQIQSDLLHSELEASEARAARIVAETKAAMAEELERKNRELEAFSYSVSHDLRAPLRTINGFSQVLVEEYGDKLDEGGRNYVERVHHAAKRMGQLIDDLLLLSRVTRSDLERTDVNLSNIAETVADELRGRNPERSVDFVVQKDLGASADGRLMRIVFDNLVGNAWKFTTNQVAPRVEFGCTQKDSGLVYFIKDNGAGFDMDYASKLFNPFQRLHTEAEFPGTGIGLATVGRIIDRHGGKVWAEGAVGQGATVFFTLPG